MRKNLQFLKHAISYLTVVALIASVVISSFSAGFNKVNASTDVWDGTTASSYAGGTGTVDDPYLISTGAQLHKMVSENSTIDKSTGVHFKLTGDIYLNDVKNTDIDKVSAPKEWYRTTSGVSYIFAGNFDGNGHTIYGLYVNSGNRGGLFPQIGKATIQNLMISKSYIASEGRPGAIAGAVWTGYYSTISKCYIDSSVTVKGKDSAGGIVGYVGSATIRIYDSCSLATLSANNNVYAAMIGGTADNVNCDMSISGCWTVGNELVQKASKAKLATTTCYNPTDIAAVTGTTAISTMPMLDWVDTWKVTATVPTLKFTSINPYWDGAAATAYDSGSGTANDPYIIANGAQLYKMVVENGTNDKSAPVYFELKNNIYLNDVSKAGWERTGATPWYTVSGSDYYFNDNLNGAGFTIFGLYVKPSDVRGGLFPQISDGATITDLTISDAVIAGTKGRSGALAGTVQPLGNKAEVIISNCGVVKTSVTDRYAAGGLVGTFTAGCSITNCYFNGSLTSSENYTGGIVATGWGAGAKLTNCYSIGAYPVCGDQLKNYTIKNVYTNIATASKSGIAVEGVTSFTGEDEAKMKGTAAKTNLVDFDFETIWKTVDNDYPVLLAPSKNKYWNGKAAESYAGGDGTEAKPYLISNAAQLYKMVSENGTNDGSAQLFFALTKDIHINDVAQKDWTTKSPTPWFAAKGTTYYFNDVLDGCGFTIYGLYCTAIDTRAGLFPQLSDGATILNTRISDAVISGSNGRSGAFAGTVQPLGNKGMVMFSSCSVENTTVTDRYAAGGFVGTFTGSCSFTNCYFNGTLECKDKVAGGIIPDGWNATAKITNCYSVGDYPVSGNNIKNYTLENVYTNVAVSPKSGKSVSGVTSFTGIDEAKMKGQAAKENLAGFNFTKFWMTTDSYPILIKRSGDGTVYDTGKAGDIWSGNVSKEFAGGEGTEADPYLIETAGQLAKLVQLSMTGSTTGKHYKLTADIYLNDTSKANWKDTANQWFYASSYGNSFHGIFDGNGHVVSGIYVNVKRQANTYTGLFPCIGADAVIKNVGVVNSQFILDGTIEMHAGTIAGFVDIYDINKVTEERYPRISQCFGDSTVNIEAKFPGGILASAGRPVIIENCFFTGDTSSYFGKYGAILGYTWMSYGGIQVNNCYAAKQSIGTMISQDNSSVGKYTNCYSSGPQAMAGITRVYISAMRGEAAKQSMSMLDFENIWVIRDNQTPGLRIFDPKSYVTTNESDTVTLSFVTNSDLKIAPVSGLAYAHIDLPVPQRTGYIFGGWYAFPELDVPYSLTTFPSFDTSLYAKWILTGIEQTFEDYPNTEYDLDKDYELYRPASDGYDATYVHAGAKSMHRFGNTDIESDFLIFYEEELEIGKTYTMTFWATTDQESAAVDVSLVHATWPDIHEPTLGVEKIASMNLTKGNWKQYTHIFTAQSKWLSIRTTGGNSIFFDDFFILSTDDGSLKSPHTGGTDSAVTYILVGTLLLGAVFTIVLGKKYKYLCE